MRRRKGEKKDKKINRGRIKKWNMEKRKSEEKQRREKRQIKEGEGKYNGMSETVRRKK